MGNINVLDKHVAELIAAGEVVERPSSVIKELLENSIDAKSTVINVEIKNGGTTFIRVSDNGSGILRDDIRVAFLRHATSKVKDENDLLKIGTLGFRGEALASISSVSHVELITKTKNEDIGTKYSISGGNEEEFEDIGCPNGTTFIIRDLFYNVPARLKFLKSDVSEGNAIANVIDKLALSHPEISFSFIRDQKQVLKTSGDGKLISAIYTVYGKDFADSLIPVKYELSGIRVYGYISKPEFSRPNRNMQNFFLNGRFVLSKTFMAAITEACKNYVMVGKHASCVLFVDIPVDAVDVNVHPTKLEVRFINEKPVFDAVYHGIKTSFLTNESPVNVKIDENKVNPFELANKVFRDKNDTKANSNVSYINTPSKLKDEVNPLDVYSKESIKLEKKHQRFSNDFNKIHETDKNKNFNQTIDNNLMSSEIEKVLDDDKDEISLIKNNDEISFKYIGEIFNTYIIVELYQDKQILLIDKHAAHERIIYEQLKEEKSSGFSQMFLVPISITLSKKDYDSVINNLDLFKKAAFDIEDFGSGNLLIRSAPQYLDNEDVESIVLEMAGHISDSKSDITSEKVDWIYHNVSCRAAIKAGNKSSKDELINLAKTVLNNKNLRHCPHGRPVCISMSKNEIEKIFGRI